MGVLLFALSQSQSAVASLSILYGVNTAWDMAKKLALSNVGPLRVKEPRTKKRMRI